MQPGYVDAKTRKRLLEIRELILREFTPTHWRELAAMTGSIDIVQGHPRLLRSLSFNDDDYADLVLPMLVNIVGREKENLAFIETYLAEKFDFGGEVISTAPSKSRKILFAPSVFDVPEGKVDPNLVAVMMPFAPEFEPVFASIKDACDHSAAKCLRVKDIWEHSTIIQDVFGLIFRAQVVICDFSTRNPNVFYEAGIAHTLGKHVIPLSQSAADVPFDVQHHRYLSYLNNGEGRMALTQALRLRLSSLLAI